MLPQESIKAGLAASGGSSSLYLVPLLAKPASLDSPCASSPVTVNPLRINASDGGNSYCKTPPDQVAEGMLYYAASSVFYSAMGVCSKLLENDGYPVWELTLYRALVILTISTSAILTTGADTGQGILTTTHRQEFSCSE